MESRRILMVTTYYPPYHLGGDALHVKLLTKELTKAGHDVYVVHLLDPFYIKRGREAVKEPPEPDSHIFSIKSPYGSLSIGKSYVFGYSRYINKKIKGIVEQVKPDVIHYHNIAGFGPSVFKIGSCFKIYTAHDYWPICQMNNLLDYRNHFCKGPNYCSICSVLLKRPPQIWRYNNEALLNYVDCIICPSTYMANTLKDNGISNRIVVLPNFVKKEKIGHYHKDAWKEKSYCLYVGILERHKGVIELINAYRNMKEINDNLIIVGRGSQVEKIASEALKDNRVHLSGWVSNDELGRLYANAKAVIIPSIWPENNPLVAIEALSYGTPIIVSNQGGLPEIAEKIDSSLIFSSVSDIEYILNRLECEPLSRQFIFNIFEQNYSSKAFLNEYLNLLDFNPV